MTSGAAGVVPSLAIVLGLLTVQAAASAYSSKPGFTIIDQGVTNTPSAVEYVRSSADCWTLCERESQCQSAVYSSSQKTCWLKAVSHSVAVPDQSLLEVLHPDLAVMPEPAAQAPAAQAGPYTVVRGRVIPGHGVPGSPGPVEVDSEAECWAYCQGVSGCKTAQYIQASRRCWSKSIHHSGAQDAANWIRILHAAGAAGRSVVVADEAAAIETELEIENDAAIVAREQAPEEYNSNFFVHAPRAFGTGAIKATFTNLGRVSGMGECQQTCWDRYGNECIYAQYLKGADCFIGKTCTGNACSDVGSVNVRGPDQNRIWCMNEHYREQWKTWTTGKWKGPVPCSHVGDGDVLRFTVDMDGNRVK